MPSTDKQRSSPSFYPAASSPSFYPAASSPSLGLPSLSTRSRRDRTLASSMLAMVASLTTLGCNRGPTVREGESATVALTRIEAEIASRYSDVTHLDREALSGLLETGPEPILVDVREPSEHQVSHLRGAIRVEPSASASEVLKRLSKHQSMHQNDANDRPVVFYCSVGERSSAMARAVAAKLDTTSTTKVYNLEGGIFGWSNDRRPLVDDVGKTNSVHPYNDRWGQLLSDRSTIRRKPRSPGR